MNNFRIQYKADAEEYQIDPYLVMKTANKIKKAKRNKKRISLKILIPAIIVITITATAVYAGYDYVSKYIFTKPPVPAHVTKESTDFEQMILEENNVKLTIKNIVAGSNLMYITFDFEMLDGTPLQVNNDNEKSFLLGQFFKKAYIECEGKKYEIYPRRWDIAEVQNKATFEATLENADEIIGKEVKLVLNDYTDEVERTSDIEFMYDSLADIYKKGEAEKNFIETGNYIVYADGTSAKSYTLPEGKNKIYFSNKYKDAYIDNFGFKKSGEKPQHDCFYISIVPSTNSEKKELEKLIFKNIHNGEKAYFPLFLSEDYEKDKEYNGDRVVIAFDGYTLNHDFEKRDMKETDLSKFILVSNEETKKRVLQKGKWEIEFLAESNNEEHTFKINQTIGENRIDSITLSATKLIVKGNCNYDKDVNGDMYQFMLIMNDGTEIPVGMKVSGWLDEKGLEFILQSVVDINEVKAIKMWDTIIELE